MVSGLLVANPCRSDKHHALALQATENTVTMRRAIDVRVIQYDRGSDARLGDIRHG